MIDVLIAGLVELFQPIRFGMLLTGVFLGLLVGVIPGLGGVFGLTILVPITYSLDPMAAVALLLGLASVTTTSDTVPAVLLGVPGTVGAAATVVDGHELAKQGKAAQALGAAYASSLVGGLIGAVCLALALPLMRPVVMLLNYGDLLAISIFGLTLVGLLTGRSWLRGLLAALLGVAVSLVGLDPYSGSERWTFGNFYFWDGLPTAIVFLGLFGISELTAVLARGKVARMENAPNAAGLMVGLRLAAKNWPLVFRSGLLGSFLGAVPGIGVTVIEWVAYGSAARHRADGPEFGQGNIRGVIAPESANNSKEGGALLPTLAFGIPGSATMAILLGAFAIHGIVPGPRLLENEAPLLVLMILSIAIANIIGTMVCIGMTPTLARLAQVPATMLVPMTLVFVVLGAFYTNGAIMDLAVLLAFGMIGIVFKRLGWSRPAFALGFVLGPNIERFFVLTYQISGWEWLYQPLVLVIVAAIAGSFIRRINQVRRGQNSRRDTPEHEVLSRIGDPIFATFLLAVLIFMAVSIWPLPFAARLLPLIVIGLATLLAIMLLGTGFEKLSSPARSEQDFHRGNIVQLPEVKLAGLLILLIVSVLCLGHILGSLVFVFISVSYIGREGWFWASGLSILAALISFILFNLLVPRAFPEPLFLAVWR